MTVSFAMTCRNAAIDAVVANIGDSPKLRIYSGATPADITSAASGTLLAEMDLPAEWMGPASNGVASKLGTWEDPEANADGVAGYYRITTTGGVAKIQGDVTKPDGAGSLKLDNTNIAAGQKITISSFTITG